jgi:hypothetical protein
MEALLDTTVEQVSRPNPGFFLAGAPYCRGYLLEGYGFVFVLPARWLPQRPVVMRTRRIRPAAPNAADPGNRVLTVNRREPGLRELEVQVEAFKREAEQQRAEAERAFEEMTRELRAILSEAQVASGPRTPRRALPAAAPLPPPATPDGTPESPEPVTAPAVPAPAEPSAPAPPLPPSVGPLPEAPWVFWGEPKFDEPEQESKSPERLVADVRDAVVAALEAYGPGLTTLRADETISVVVDFVAGAPFIEEGEAQPSRSLTLRVRKRDLDDRRAGRLGPEELRRKVEAAEY